MYLLLTANCGGSPEPSTLGPFRQRSSALFQRLVRGWPTAVQRHRSCPFLHLIAELMPGGRSAAPATAQQTPALQLPPCGLTGTLSHALSLVLEIK